MRCPACGLENDPQRDFCASCAEELTPGAAAGFEPPRAKDRNLRRLQTANTAANHAWKGFRGGLRVCWLGLKAIPIRIWQALPRALLVLASLLPGLGHLLLGKRCQAGRLFLGFVFLLAGWQCFIGTLPAALMLLGVLLLIGYSLADIQRYQAHAKDRGPLRSSQILFALSLVFALLAAVPAIINHYWERATPNLNIVQLSPPVSRATSEIAFARGDTLFFNRRVYQNRSPARGDIVLARMGRGEYMLTIQRILAIPGDVLVFRKGWLYLNGAELPAEAYPLQFEISPGAAEDRFVQSGWERHLSAGEYAVWSIGPWAQELNPTIRPTVVTRSDIRSKAWLLYSPFYHRRLIKSLNDQPASSADRGN